MKFPLLFLAAASTLFSQAIDGKVSSSATGAPLAGVAVTIASAGQAAYQTTTDAGGSFRIEAVKAGYYTANFSKELFLELDANSPARKPFNLTPGSDPVHLEVQLVPFGKISGRVLTAEGDPVPESEVLLDSSQFGRSLTSDKNGSFSFDVSPGRYTLLAKPPGQLKPPETGPHDRFGWVPTYYPGVVDAQAAIAIQLNAGAELSGNDIKLKTTSLHRVRGVIRDLHGDPVARVVVRTARTDETSAEDMETVSAEDGSFEFPNLYAGEWSIFAERVVEGLKQRASAAATLSGRDLEDVNLRLTSPFTVRGSIAFDGSVGLRSSVKVFLRPLAIAGSQGLDLAVVDNNGTFRIENVYPGAFRIVALSPGPSFFLSSIKMAERDVLGQPVELYPGSFPIQVAFESKGGTVRGKVEDCGGATIVLAPQDSSLQETQFVRTAKCGDGGRFEVTALRPGDYYAFAFDRFDSPVDLLSGLDQSLINMAVQFHVKRGETATIELRIISRAP